MVRAVEKAKRQKQVSVKMEEDLYARLAKACSHQEHREGQLVRILFEWALPFYEEAKSVEALKHYYAPKKSHAVQEELKRIEEAKRGQKVG